MTLIEETKVDVLRQARIDLAAALRAAALYGYNEGIDNHFSYAVPGSDDLFLLNPYGPDWSELTAVRPPRRSTARATWSTATASGRSRRS